MSAASGVLRALLRVLADDGFALAVFGVVVIAAVLAFAFGAAIEIVASVLILGLITAVAEGRLRAK